MSNSAIAAHMHVAETTVKTYVFRVLTKLERRNRVELALLCQDHGRTWRTDPVLLLQSCCPSPGFGGGTARR